MIRFLTCILFIWASVSITSCTEEKKDQLNDASLEVISAKGIPMISDTLLPPVIIKATSGSSVKASSPDIVASISPSLGEAGGISYMHNYTTNDGLALDAISYGHKSSICDRSGNLWIGTLGGGVSRYDGASFTQFSSANGLAGNIVYSICEDRHGVLWFGTEGGGLSRYDGISFKTFNKDSGLAGNSIYSILEDKHSVLWFASSNEGVSRYDGETFQTFNNKDGLAGNTVLSIAEDLNGNLWFGTLSGVSRYDGKSFHNYTVTDGLADDRISAITVDKDGRIWFGTLSNGISCFDGNSFKTWNKNDGLAGNVIYSMHLDAAGNLWCGTSGDGVSRFDGKTFTTFTTNQGLCNNIVWSITEDKGGSLWFGTNGGGISRYDGKLFTNFTTKQGLAHNIVWGITEDSQSNIWFGTEGGGVSKYTGKSFENYSTKQGLSNNIVFCIQEDQNHHLWFGTDAGGLSRYDGKEFRHYNEENGLANNTVFCITRDRKNQLWFGTLGGGVSCFTGDTFINYSTNQGLAHDMIYCITEDRKGNLWFGTSGGGISKFDGKTFTNFTAEHGIASNIVYCISEDHHGNLWFGSEGGGVTRYDGTSFLRLTKTQGLPDNSVTQVIPTEKNEILVATNFGLALIKSFKTKDNETSSNNNVILADNNLNNKSLSTYHAQIETYNSVTGYPVKDVNSGSHCLFKDSKGIIWIATGADKTALVRFDYAAIVKKKTQPVVVINNIKVNEEPIAWHSLPSAKQSASIYSQQEVLLFGKPLSEKQRNQHITKFGNLQFDSIRRFYPVPENLLLPYNNNHLSISFHAIETARPNLIKYQYFLEGYDEDWSPAVNKTEVNYGNIHEGAYTFLVRAQNPDGIWSTPVKYSFTVLPPWYRTWWMYCLYSIFSIAGIAALVYWNGRRLIAFANTLKKMVNEATQELRLQKEIVEQQKEEAEFRKKEVEFKNREILSSINYAKRIQSAILPPQRIVKDFLHESFILYLPKDIVAGDFYWMESIDNTIFFAACDCTGHGVPGAMVSVVCNNALNRALFEHGERIPGKIFDKSRELLLEVFSKSDEDVQDGMDASLCALNLNSTTLLWSGANNPLWILRPNILGVYEIHEFVPDKQPIGKAIRPGPFNTTGIPLITGDVIYLFTDGYTDQFGGAKGKKLNRKRFKELLLSMAHLPMDEQHAKLLRFHDEYRGNGEQVDDICVIGVRV